MPPPICTESTIYPLSLFHKGPSQADVTVHAVSAGMVRSWYLSCQHELKNAYEGRPWRQEEGSIKDQAKADGCGGAASRNANSLETSNHEQLYGVDPIVQPEQRDPLNY